MENNYTCYKINLPENKEVISKFRELKNSLNKIEGIEAYHYKLTSVLHTMIIVIKDDKNRFLNDYAKYYLKKFGKAITIIYLTDKELLNLEKLK